MKKRFGEKQKGYNTGDKYMEGHTKVSEIAFSIPGFVTIAGETTALWIKISEITAIQTNASVLFGGCNTVNLHISTRRAGDYKAVLSKNAFELFLDEMRSAFDQADQPLFTKREGSL